MRRRTDGKEEEMWVELEVTEDEERGKMTKVIREQKGAKMWKKEGEK